MLRLFELAFPNNTFARLSCCVIASVSGGFPFGGKEGPAQF